MDDSEVVARLQQQRWHSKTATVVVAVMAAAAAVATAAVAAKVVMVVGVFDGNGSMAVFDSGDGLRQGNDKRKMMFESGGGGGGQRATLLWVAVLPDTVSTSVVVDCHTTKAIWSALLQTSNSGKLRAIFIDGCCIV